MFAGVKCPLLRPSGRSFKEGGVKRATQIENWIQQTLAPTHLEVEDESSHHAVAPGAESHFRVVIVSEAFSKKSLVERHRLIYAGLGKLFADSLHALSLQLFTQAEWDARNQVANESPACAGGDGATRKPK